MKSFYIKSFGCSRRNIDSERIKNFLIANGLKAAKSPDEADQLVVVTCGLTIHSTDNCISCIKEYKQYKGKLVVYGCLPAMNPEKLSSVFDGSPLVTSELDKLDELIDLPIKFTQIEDANRAFQPETCEPDEMQIESKSDILPKENEHPDKAKSSIASLFKKPEKEIVCYGIGFYNQYFSLRISEGCAGNCSYCTIRKAIGKTKSKPEAILLSELRKAINTKQYQINVVSSDSGSYGLDIGTNLPSLLKAILNENENIVIEYLEDIHPIWICRYKNEMEELIKTKRIKSLLSAIQSGNKRILKLMNRYTDIKEFVSVIDRFKQINPSLRIKTQVIVGFPTETNREFRDTINFINRSKVDEVDIFPYYEVKGSAAVNLTPKVSEEIIEKRIQKLTESINKFSCVIKNP